MTNGVSPSWVYVALFAEKVLSLLSIQQLTEALKTDTLLFSPFHSQLFQCHLAICLDLEYYIVLQ